MRSQTPTTQPACQYCASLEPGGYGHRLPTRCPATKPSVLSLRLSPAMLLPCAQQPGMRSPPVPRIRRAYTSRVDARQGALLIRSMAKTRGATASEPGSGVNPCFQARACVARGKGLDLRCFRVCRQGLRNNNCCNATQRELRRSSTPWVGRAPLR